MTRPISLHALVPAAGRSRRMGCQKLAMPLGSKVVLARVIESLQVDALGGILVVLGPTSKELADIVPSGVDVLLLSEQTEEMRQTLEHGLAWMESRHRLADDDGILIALGDQPTLRRELVLRLAGAYHGAPGSIVVPTFTGRRGHPIIIPWRLFLGLRDLPADVGLNALIENHRREVREIPWHSPRILEDLDTPGQFDAHRLLPWD